MKGKPKAGAQATVTHPGEAPTVAILKQSATRGLIVCDAAGREIDYSAAPDVFVNIAMPAAMRSELVAFCCLASIPVAELVRRLIAHYLKAEPLPPVRERDLETLLQERIEALKRPRK
jgi:uncharacterized NAD-dependent epimerase/dehydratase family protein